MGGYKLVNFNNVDLVTSNADGVTIPGLYSAIENNHRKPLLLHGLVIDGIEKADVYSPATTGDNEFTFTAYGTTITVSSLDVVKATV